MGVLVLTLYHEHTKGQTEGHRNTRLKIMITYFKPEPMQSLTLGKRTRVENSNVLCFFFFFFFAFFFC